MNYYAIFMGYLLLFAIGGLAGWCLELFFRRIVHRQWVNPGFLNGPLLPLYGFGVMILYFISDLPLDWWWKVVLFFVVLTAVEYLAGIIFIKGMGLKLWDYSKCWGNIQGIICPLFSLAWGLVGVVFYLLLYSPLKSVFVWLESNLYLSFFLGIVYGILLIDLCISFHVSLKLRTFAKKAKEILPYEQVKTYIMQHNKKTKEKLRFVLPFRTKNFGETLENYIRDIKDRAESLLRKDDRDDDQGKEK